MLIISSLVVVILITVLLAIAFAFLIAIDWKRTNNTLEIDKSLEQQGLLQAEEEENL